MSESDIIVSALNQKLATINRADLSLEILNELKTLLIKLNVIESIDKSLVSTLKDLFRDDSLLAKESLDNIIESLVNSSTIVFFKSAQLCKVYNNDQLETMLEGQLRTMYKHFKDTYEVVPNSSKQKIIIMCDISVQNQINDIKTYIKEFMHISKKLTSFSENDIICYNANNMIHILLTNYYVNSATEREHIVTELVKFIRARSTNSELSKQIMSYIEPNNDFDSADIILMPNERSQFSGKYIQYIDGLISNIQNCDHISSGKSITVNFNIVDNSTNINSNNSNSNNTNITDNSDNIEEFIEYIKSEQPSWFKSGKWIKKPTLSEKYTEKFQTAVPYGFYKLTKNKLWLSEKRNYSGDKITTIRLMKFENL